MKKLLASLALLVLAGCANQDIIIMDDISVQKNDLRDLDWDGVIEAREQCNDTVLGASVNNDGCPTDKTVQQSFRLDVKFANDSVVLRRSNYAKLEQLAAFLKDQPDANVTIEGHASKVGNPAHNLKLSQQRAKAVANALVQSFDIPRSRVNAKGFGDTKPLIDGDSDYAHSMNRRVMATLSGSYNTTDMRWTIFTFNDH